MANFHSVHFSYERFWVKKCFFKIGYIIEKSQVLEKKLDYLTLIGETLLKRNCLEATNFDEDEENGIKIPVFSIEELKNLEAILATKANKMKLIKKLLLIGGNHSKMLRIRIIDSLLTKDP